MILRLELPTLVTISKVEVTPDLKSAKVGITVLENNKEAVVLSELKGQIYQMQGNLIRKLKMKVVPRITFFIDKAEEYASHINELLKEASEDDEQY